MAPRKTKKSNGSNEQSNTHNVYADNGDSFKRIDVAVGVIGHHGDNMETVDEDSTTNDHFDTSATDRPKTVANRTSNVWDYMRFDGSDKARCEICGIILSRKNGGTTGLRKHLVGIHKITSVSLSSVKKRSRPIDLPIAEQKKLDSLIVRCIIEDGRSFGDMRRSGIFRLINHFSPGK